MNRLFDGMNFVRLFVALFGLMISLASAQVNILVATAQQPNQGTLNNLFAEFTSDASWNVTDARNTLGRLTSVPTPSFAGYDVVVIATGRESLQPDEMAALQNAIDNRLSTSFVLFFDGCCGNGVIGSSDSIDNLVSIANNSFAQPITASSGSFTNNGTEDFLLTSSPLATGFPSVINGRAYSPFFGIPDGNVIYRSSDNNDVGFIIPVTESVGACVFAMADVSPFELDIYAMNQGQIAPAFINAATNPQGACFLRSTPVPSKVPSSSMIGLLLSVLMIFWIVGFARSVRLPNRMTD